MSESSLAELAVTLGLSSGPEGLPSSVSARPEVRDQLIVDISMFIEVHDTSKDWGIVVEDLCSQYLPSIVASVLHRKEGGQVPFLLLVNWLLRSEQEPGMVRFVRERPEQIISLYLIIAELLAEESTDLEVKLKEPPSISIFHDTLVAYCALYLMLVFHLPDTVLFPRLSPSLVTTFQAAIRLHNEGKGDRCAVEEMSNDGLFRILELAAGNDAGQGARSQFDSVPRVWDSCQAQIDATASPCVGPVDGGMKACSRCFAVRYCSREHQKADWKRHRQTCFKPSW